MSGAALHVRDYFDVLDLIHQAIVPQAYIEIGVASGKSLGLALPGTRLIGIDPAADIRHSVSGELHLFNETSDSFFASSRPAEVLQGLSADLSFIDGMHLFEVALKDFRNLETISKPTSVILLHDCLPPTPANASRNRSTAIWTGDVWRVIVALRSYRPSLKIQVLDVAPTGLAIVSGLDPGSRTLFDRFDEICAWARSQKLPEDRAGVMELLEARRFEWSSVRAMLPDRPVRQTSVRELTRRRSFRRPTVADVKWRLRRFAKSSPIGRLARRSPESAPWSGDGS